mmetsp:Transcript_1818/g.5631  ORF Transcript_1818/g.5631 Transcript_1818/m.5631 type:complete len:386 (-) Transcript_1818:569-1726(-)
MAHLHQHDLLLLRWQVAQNVLLHPPQQVRLEHVVQLLDLLLGVNILIVLQESLHLVVRKLFWVDEVHEHEELLQVVLQRGPRQDHPLLALELLQHSKELARAVLQPVALVHDHGPVAQLAQVLGSQVDHLVRRQDEVALHPALQRNTLLPFGLAHGKLVLADDLAVRCGPRVVHHVELRGPLLGLPLPIEQGGERGDDDMGPGTPPGRQGGHQRDGLDRLAQAHLVPKDDVLPGLPRELQPVQPLKLVRVQLVVLAAPLQKLWGLLVLVELPRPRGKAALYKRILPLAKDLLGRVVDRAPRPPGLHRRLQAEGLALQQAHLLPGRLSVPQALPLHKVLLHFGDLVHLVVQNPLHGHEALVHGLGQVHALPLGLPPPFSKVLHLHS